MLKEERLKKIMDILKEKKHITTKEISELFSISEITVRRDLRFLESQGLIERKHGGASLKNFFMEIPFFQRLDIKKFEKKLIAQKAVEIIENGQTIAMSGGSTIYYVAKALENSPIYDLTIITNSITTAWAIIGLNKEIKLIHSGGTVKPGSFECIGSHALNFFSNMTFDIYFLGIDGLDFEKGITFSDFEERNIAKTIIKNSKKVVVVADGDKLEKVAPFKVCDISDIDILITKTSKNLERKYKSYKINLINLNGE